MYLQKQFQVNQNLRTSFELGELPCGHMLRWRQLLLKSCLGTSLVVQGVRFCLPMQGMQVQSLVGELRSTCLLAKKQNLKQKQYYNKFNKDLKKKAVQSQTIPQNIHWSPTCTWWALGMPLLRSLHLLLVKTVVANSWKQEQTEACGRGLFLIHLRPTFQFPPLSLTLQKIFVPSGNFSCWVPEIQTYMTWSTLKIIFKPQSRIPQKGIGVQW